MTNSAGPSSRVSTLVLLLHTTQELRWDAVESGVIQYCYVLTGAICESIAMLQIDKHSRLLLLDSCIAALAAKLLCSRYVRVVVDADTNCHGSASSFLYERALLERTRHLCV